MNVDIAEGIRLLHAVARANGKKAELNPPVDYYLEFTDGLLTLHFTLPFKTPVKAQSLERRDVRSDLVRRLLVRREGAGDASSARRRPASLRWLRPGRGRSAAPQGPAGRSVLQQPGAVEQFRRAVRQQDRGEMSVTTLAGRRKATLGPAARADRRVGSRLGAADAFAQNPFGAPRAPPPAAASADGIAGWLLAKQAEFYRMLSGTIRNAKTDGSAVWLLMGISFAYGMFPRRRPGSRQGGDLVLPGRQRGDLEARHHAVVPLRAAAGAGRGRAWSGSRRRCSARPRRR